MEKKDYEKALTCLKEARVIAAQPELYQFEAGHRGSAFLTPRTDPSNEATVLSLTGTVYDQMKRHDDAEQSYREALKAMERAPGNNNPQFVTILQNLARSQTEAGRPQAALETILRALSIDDNKPGRSEAFDVSSAILGRALLGLGGEEQDRALAQLSAGGRNAPSPGSFGRVMLVAAESAVRKDAAAGASFLARLVAHVQSSTSLPNREAAALFLRAGTAARQSADLVAAEKYTKLALEKLSGEASASLTPNRALIEIYTEQKKHAEAEAAHDRQIAFMKSVFGDKDSRLANALEDKAAFLESLGRAEEAKALHNEAAQVRIAAFKR